MKSATARLAVAPFECAIAVWLILAGTAQFARWGLIDPVNALLPAWEVYLLAAVTIAGGAAVPAGLARSSIALEAAGLLFQCGVFISRLILYGTYLGADATFFLSGAFDIVFLVACFTRLSTVRTRRLVIELRKP